MAEMTKHGKIGQAAMKADMDRKTARKYVAAGRLPSELVKARDWRTRPDPFETAWAEVEVRLRDTPALEGKTLFEMLRSEDPARFEDGCGSIASALDGSNLDHLTSVSRGRWRGSGLGTAPSA